MRIEARNIADRQLAKGLSRNDRVLYLAAGRRVFLGHRAIVFRRLIEVTNFAHFDRIGALVGITVPFGAGAADFSVQIVDAAREFVEAIVKRVVVRP